MKKITIVGCGAWGFALGLLLRSNGHAVTLLAHAPEVAAALLASRTLPSLPGVALPPDIAVTADPSSLSEADVVLFAPASGYFRSTVLSVRAFIPADALLISATKGIEADTGLRMSELLSSLMGAGRPVVTLSGPSHAEEVSRGMETGCVVAGSDRASCLMAQELLMSPVFRVYVNDDAVGVEICGAAKNVVALGAGVLDGIGAGDNLKAMYMTRAMAQISALCTALGGQISTCMGLAGMGDLIVTCCSRHSRNRLAGQYIGAGESVEDALCHVGAVVEGYYAARSLERLCARCGLRLPIFHAVYACLYEGLSPKQGIAMLMNRDGREEFDLSYEAIRQHHGIE